MYPRAARCGVYLFLSSSTLSSCLPADTRPEPGSVFTTVSGSEATRHGVSTADGWSISFDRVLLGVGPIQLGDDCTKYAEYSEPGYDRVLDVTHPEPQKLSVMYGLGRCDVDFQISPPSEDALVGVGVGAADKTFLRTPGSDRYLSQEGITLHMEGLATQGASTGRFIWDIRQSLFYRECRAFVSGQEEVGLDLRSGVPLNYNLLIEAEAFFRDDLPRESGALRFAPFAEADALRGNADGLVTLEELGAIRLSELRALAPYGADLDGVETLQDYVYRVLYRTFLRFRDNGSCAVAIEED